MDVEREDVVMKVALISDTHSMHVHLQIPECDLLIHAGDFSGRGTLQDLVNFLAWFSGQPAHHRVFIAGNHDVFCEEHSAEAKRLIATYGDSVRYLCDGETTIDGLRVWGSPVTPRFFDWAFNRDRGEAIRCHWDMIPDGIDVLVTHGPPMGLGDRNRDGEHVGCQDLLDRVLTVAPALHAFGHIHEGRGEYRVDGLETRFINASSLDSTYRHMRGPVVVDL